MGEASTDTRLLWTEGIPGLSQTNMYHVNPERRCLHGSGQAASSTEKSEGPALFECGESSQPSAESAESSSLASRCSQPCCRALARASPPFQGSTSYLGHPGNPLAARNRGWQNVAMPAAWSLHAECSLCLTGSYLHLDGPL